MFLVFCRVQFSTCVLKTEAQPLHRPGFSLTYPSSIFRSHAGGAVMPEAFQGDPAAIKASSLH